MGNKDTQFIAGERGLAWMHQLLAPHARLSNRIALAIAGGLGIAVLGSYYWHVGHRVHAGPPAPASAMHRAELELPLPDFHNVASMTGADAAVSASQAQPALEPHVLPLEASPASEPVSMGPAHTPRPSALDRRLSGTAYAPARQGSGQDPLPGTPSSEIPSSQAGPVDPVAVSAAGSDTAHRSASPLATARMLPDQRLLLPKGAFIDCTLETAIDSSLPGMTTCITATDTFGTDGKVVLLERGSKLTGETRGQVQQGLARIFVIWTEARTPTGVVVPLDSPAADELGRSGLTGSVDRHFWQRFGAALLISTIDAGAAAAVQSTSRAGGAVIYNPTASDQVATEALKGTLDIPPTVRKDNGDRIQILVAHDIDFRSVYELRHAVSAP